MAKHAELSPSSAKRWMGCPGSVVLSRGLPDSSSQFADEGTAAHFLGATCLENGTNAGLYLGRDILLCKAEDGSHFECFRHDHEEPVVLNQFTVDGDMADYVQTYVDYVRDVVTSTGGTLFVEVRVAIDHLTQEEEAAGTSDVVILAGDEIIVIDLKYGMGVEVSADENEQLLMYASAAARHFEMAGDFDKVRIAICQPRISSLPSEWSCSMAELRVFEAKVQLAAQQVIGIVDGAVEAYLNPTDDTCKWCKAKAKCPALEAKVQADIGADFDDILTGPNPAAGVADLDAESIGKKMACIDLIEVWCTAIRAECERKLLTGEQVPGYKVVQGKRGNRAWSDAEKADRLLARLKLKQDERYTFKLISPTQAQKLFKDDAEKWAKVEALITQSEGKPSVAPESDKRPAISVAAVDVNDFDDLT